jgi:uncharacterized protein YqjF (DUF2071 family)
MATTEAMEAMEAMTRRTAARGSQRCDLGDIGTLVARTSGTTRAGLSDAMRDYIPMDDRLPDLDSRLALRHRPPGSPVLFQSWGQLLFMHWPVPVASLRPLIPAALSLDTHEGRAWVALTPFTLWGLRPRFLPALPGIGRFHELNVRTYVHHRGVPGVWFFSLDASRLLPVLGARAFYHLPYRHAAMTLEERGDVIQYASRRLEGPAPRAAFHAVWTAGPRRPPAEPGSLEFFLIERYCLYAEHRGRLSRARIAHVPWPLREAAVSAFSSTMMEAAGFAQPAGDPLLHNGGPVDVEVWPLEPV